MTHAHMFVIVRSCSFVKVHVANVSALAPMRNVDYQWDVAQAMVKCALWKAEDEHKDVLRDLSVTLSPASAVTVKTTKPFTSGALVLVPVTTTITKGCADKKKVAANRAVDVAMDFQNIKVVSLSRKVDAPKKEPEGVASGQSRIKEVVAFVPPYWLVKTTDRAHEANVSTHMKVVDGIKIPVLKNSKAIAANQELYLLIPH